MGGGKGVGGREEGRDTALKLGSWDRSVLGGGVEGEGEERSGQGERGGGSDVP